MESYDPFSPYYLFLLTSCVVNIVLSLVSAVGNCLVLVAIWRNPTLRAPSYILLAGLTLSNLCVGSMTQPIYISLSLGTLITAQKPLTKDKVTILVSVGAYFCQVSLATISAMSIERWLFMSRRTVLTVRRTGTVYVALLILPLPFIVVNIIGGYPEVVIFRIIYLLIGYFCLTVTPVAYYKVFQIIRRHQHSVHVHTTEMSSNSNFNLHKYKKSVFTILYTTALFIITYVPFQVWVVIATINGENSTHETTSLIAFHITVTIAFTNSSFNPLLCLWRMKEIRDGVKSFLGKIKCR